MPNKTIYVSDADVSLFEEAKELAGEALSSVIARALKEFVARNQHKQKGMKEIALKIGKDGSEREQRFIGIQIGNWQGFSADKQWFLKATIYRTQKNNWAILLQTLYKASLLTDKDSWKKNGDYLINPKKNELLVGSSPDELKSSIPHDLYITLTEYAQEDESPVEYLDI